MAALIPRPNYPPYGGGEDAGRQEADELLKATEKKVHKVYEQAAREMRDKADKYLQQFIQEDRDRVIKVVSGELSEDDYKRWRRTHILQGRRWYEMSETLATDMTNSNLIATQMINGTLPDVFAIGYNYGLYQGEIDGGFQTSFSLYNHDAVERLIAEEPDLLPDFKVQVGEDIRWNQKKITSAMTQSIMQGERIEEIAKRLAATVVGMNEKTAVRNARTAYTSAENGGRYHSYQRLKSAGVDLTVEWSATLDDRTRHSHRIMDGQRRDVDEPFEFFDETAGLVKILFPAQTKDTRWKIPPSMIWNCRCSLLCWVKGFEDNREIKADAFPDENYQSYTEWKYAKQKEEEERKAKPRVNPDNPSYGYATDFSTTTKVTGNTAEYREEKISPKKPLTSDGKSGNMGVAEKQMANGYRRSVFIDLTDQEKAHITSEIEAIGADRSAFVFRDGTGTSYSDEFDIIFVSSNVFPSRDGSLHPRDLMSERAVLAHEYYGHRANKGTKLETGSWNDEFRASYMAARDCPNLSDEDRRYLILDAMERAKDAGVTINLNDFMRRVLYG